MVRSRAKEEQALLPSKKHFQKMRGGSAGQRTRIWGHTVPRVASGTPCPQRCVIALRPHPSPPT